MLPLPIPYDRSFYLLRLELSKRHVDAKKKPFLSCYLSTARLSGVNLPKEKAIPSIFTFRSRTENMIKSSLDRDRGRPSLSLVTLLGPR
jgi:hypothetical protein